VLAHLGRRDWDKGWACVQVFEGHNHYVMQVCVCYARGRGGGRLRAFGAQGLGQGVGPCAGF
jgi:hypothetical protein